MDVVNVAPVVDFDVLVTRRQNGVLQLELFVDGVPKLVTVATEATEVSAGFVAKSAVGVMRLRFIKN